MRNRLDYNKIKWDDYFVYSEDSPTCLIWKYGNNCNNLNFRSSAGDAAGVKLYYKSGKPRAYQVYVKGKNYLVHRIIWCMINGEIDNSLVIDHVDGNGFNNNIKNIRLVESEFNTRNSCLRTDSKTNINGVYRSSNGKDNYYYVATWYENGKQRSKYFSIDKLGEKEALVLAVSWRYDKITELNLNGAGYTVRHGT